ncbi:hypothetical protein CCZ01_08970 [Helicobacter monodelphidis]|uniref:TolC family protein n=1 Tax=Helicobacter sp. 15-1451 TaxID=2004995 RepID=UPI000DCD4B9D|nr:TolC family protein [Helicobacter sp. 15-1451]RAX56629.1 hypothetical protein CCZ01_08970 [Helicobacter sp. 15-1451]
MMRLVFYLTLFCLPLLAQKEADYYLSRIQKEAFYLERQANKAQSSILRLKNISPLEVGFQDSYNYAYSPALKSRGYYIGITQPIFKSGGIFSSIYYANLNEAYNEKNIILQERSKIIDAMRLLFNLKKLELEVQQQHLLIENAGIDVLQKQEQFNAGFIDSSTLNNAILDRNQAKKQAIVLQNNFNSYRFELHKVSDLDYRNARLPTFQWLKEDEFLNQNLQVAVAQADYQQKGVQYYESISQFLPQISLNARYNKDLGDVMNMNPAFEMANSYTTFTLTFSLPLFDVGIYDKIQAAKIEQLKSALNISQIKREQRSLWTKQVQDKNLIEQKRQIAKEDLNLYESLLTDSLGRMRVGDLTNYDVKVMENSKEIRSLELQILDYEEQILFLDLYKNLEERS